MGVISPIGNSCNEFLESLKVGTNGISENKQQGPNTVKHRRAICKTEQTIQTTQAKRKTVARTTKTKTKIFVAAKLKINIKAGGQFRGRWLPDVPGSRCSSYIIDN